MARSSHTISRSIVISGKSRSSDTLAHTRAHVTDIILLTFSLALMAYVCRYPGRFCMYYMRKGHHHMEDIKCSNKGLRFRNEYFDHPV